MNYRGIIMYVVFASSAMNYAGGDETTHHKKAAARNWATMYATSPYYPSSTSISHDTRAEQRNKRACVALLAGAATGVVCTIAGKAGLNPCTVAELRASWEACGGEDCAYLISKNSLYIEEEFNAAVAQTYAIGRVYPQSDLSGHAVAQCGKSFRHSYADPRDLEEQAIRDYCDAKRDLPAGVPMYLSDEEFTKAASHCFAQNGADGIYHYNEKPGFFSRLFSDSESDDELPELVKE